MKYFILTIMNFFWILGSSFDNLSAKVSATINNIVEFSNLKGNSSGMMSDNTYNKGNRLLKTH